MGMTNSPLAADSGAGDGVKLLRCIGRLKFKMEYFGLDYDVLQMPRLHT